MKFACDDNLGKLAKYLRLLGFDTFFIEPIIDSELLSVAASQERFLLTRDSHLMGKCHPFGALLLDDNDPRTQLLTIIKTLDLNIKTEDLFSRCSRCNEVCRPAKKENVSGRVFPYILNTQDIISECPLCLRLYWKGTHYRRLLTEIKSIIPPTHIIGSWPE